MKNKNKNKILTEVEVMRMLSRTIADHERTSSMNENNNLRPGSTVSVRNVEEFAKFYADGDLEEYNHWVKKINSDGNDFYVMDEPAEAGYVLLDYNGDEIEVPIEMIGKPHSAPNTTDSEESRGMAGPSHRGRLR